jgi:drug/metabolite transporter (DMT)-like permease
MITYIFPVVGVALGAIALNETVDWRLLVGGLLVLGGIIVVNSKIKTSPQLVAVQNKHLEG